MTVALALGFGAVIGVLLGLLGGGGSILAVPALVFGLGLNMEQAIPISLIVVGVASAVGALPKIRARQIQWRLAGTFAATGIPATFAGSAVGRLLPKRALLIGFAVVTVIAGARMLADRGDTGPPARPRVRASTGVDAPLGRSRPGDCRPIVRTLAYQTR